jgi:tetratricopeptide (TPR) repeat protein
VTDWLEQAQTLFDLNRHEQCQEYLLERLAIEPGNIQALDLLAFSYYMGDQDELALEIVEKALVLAPENAQLLYRKATILDIIDRVTEALDFHLRAIEQEPRVFYHYELSEFLIRYKSYELALHHAVEGLSREPDHLGCRLQRLIALDGLNRGSKMEYVEEIKALLEEVPEDAEALDALGTLLRDRDPEEAKRAFRAVLALDPEDDDARRGFVDCSHLIRFPWLKWLYPVNEKLWEKPWWLGVACAVWQALLTLHALGWMTSSAWDLLWLYPVFVLLAGSDTLADLGLILKGEGQYLSASEVKTANIAGILVAGSFAVGMVGIGQQVPLFCLAGCGILSGLVILDGADCFYEGLGIRPLLLGSMSLICGVVAAAVTFLRGKPQWAGFVVCWVCLSLGVGLVTKGELCPHDHIKAVSEFLDSRVSSEGLTDDGAV